MRLLNKSFNNCSGFGVAKFMYSMAIAVKMRRLIGVFAIVLTLGVLSCGHQERRPGFEIDGTTGKVDDVMAYLYKYLPEYDKRTLADSVRVRNGKFCFVGTTDEPVEAYLRFSGDTTVYCFVLTNNRITFVVTDSIYGFTGTESNRMLSELVLEKRRFESRRAGVQAMYMGMCADSTLTRVSEDSLAAVFRATRIGFGETLAVKIAEMAKDCPLAARVSLRLYHDYMTQADVDSLTAVVGAAR